jgi:putative SOS response-associated peptidase YedK
MGNTPAMCGRLVIVVPDLSVLVAPFSVEQQGDFTWEPRFNLAPTQLAPVVTNEPSRRLDLFRFGLIPSWAESKQVANKMINARVETVATSRAFKRALAFRRCIVPVTGYFEWKQERGVKHPQFIHDARGTTLPLAGLWERWHARDGEIVESFAVITRACILHSIHDRMPLTVPWDQIDRWLDPSEQPASALAPILAAEPDLQHVSLHEVAPVVNSPNNDGPECIAPFSAPPPEPDRQLDLFADESAPALRGGAGRER